MKAEEIFWSNLNSEVKQLVEDFRGVASAVVLDLEGERRIACNSEVVLAAGSTIKVPVLMELFLKASDGRLDLGKLYTIKQDDRVAGSGVIQHLEGEVTLSLENLAILMINVSDNIATNVCIKRAGMDAVNELMDSVGCPDTKLRRLMIDWEGAVSGRENVTTARDMARWLEVLYRGELVDRKISDAVLSVLRKRKRSPMREGLPADISLASKTGGLEGVRCEVGLVKQDRRSYVLAVMSTYSVDDDNDQFITHLTETVHAYMSRLERFTEYGRGLPAWYFEEEAGPDGE